MSDDPENRRHPESKFKTDYPYNQATMTRGGHEFHINDAPGKESLKVGHTKGTYVELESDGGWKQTVQGKTSLYHKDGVTFTSDGQVDFKIAGNYSLNVDNSVYEAMAGYKVLGIKGNYEVGIGKNYIVAVNEDKEETVRGDDAKKVSGNYYENIEGYYASQISGIRADTLLGDWQVASGGSIDFNSDKQVQVRSAANTTVISGENIYMKSAQTFKIKCKDFIVEAETITMTTSAGDVTITASGLIKLNGQQIRLND